MSDGTQSRPSTVHWVWLASMGSRRRTDVRGTRSLFVCTSPPVASTSNRFGFSSQEAASVVPLRASGRRLERCVCEPNMLDRCMLGTGGRPDPSSPCVVRPACARQGPSVRTEGLGSEFPACSHFARTVEQTEQASSGPARMPLAVLPSSRPTLSQEPCET
jgi:hypothetical protein